MKILLVDDEPFFLEQLKQIISSYARESGVSIEIVAECYDGKEALKRISEGPPDVVISDIRMSTLDGIELSRTIQAQWPGLPVVIISGYPSFDYAREAIRSNVVDYLLKPIDAMALKKVLAKLNRVSENKRIDSLGQRMRKLMYSPQAPSQALVRELNEAIPTFRVIIVKTSLSPSNSFLSNVPLEEEEAALRTTLQAFLQPNEEVWRLASDPKYAILIVSLQSDDGVRWRTMLDNIQQLFQQMSHSAPSLIASRPVGDWNRLGTLVHELAKYLYTHTRIGQSRMIYDPDLPKADGPEPFQPVLTEVDKLRFLTLYQRKNRNGLFALLKEWLLNWEAQQMTAYRVELHLKHLMRLLADLKPMQSGERLILDSRVEEIIDVVQSHEELAGAYWTILKHSFLAEEADDEEQDELRLLFERIADYIHTHLHQSLSLKKLSEHFYISVSALCNLFRDYSGKSFVEFVTAQRLERAQEFMRAYPHMLNKEIAELVGYSDQNYFSRVFKSATGVSPSEYRAGLQL